MPSRYAKVTNSLNKVYPRGDESNTKKVSGVPDTLSSNDKNIQKYTRSTKKLSQIGDENNLKQVSRRQDNYKNTIWRDSFVSKLKESQLDSSPERVLEQAKNDIAEYAHNNGETSTTTAKSVHKALSLFEFENGLLLTYTMPEEYQPFCIQLMKQFQEEFSCTTVSENALCELTAINYVRTLVIQRKLNVYLEKPVKEKGDLLYISLLSKELDRANRYFLSSYHALRTIKQPVMQVNVLTKTAVVGQQQIVQTR